MGSQMDETSPKHKETGYFKGAEKTEEELMLQKQHEILFGETPENEGGVQEDLKRAIYPEYDYYNFHKE